MTDDAVIRAELYRDAGRLDEARRLLGDLLSREPDDVRALIVLASVELQTGGAADALSIARRAVTVEPENTGAWRMLALAQLGSRQRGAALTSAREAVRLDPDDGYSHLSLAIVSDTGPFATREALRAAREAVRLAPDDPEAHVTLGNAYLRRGRKSQGMLEFRAALAIDPMHPAAKNNRALAQIDLTPARSARDFADAVAENPRDEAASGNLVAAIGTLLSWCSVIVFAGAAGNFSVMARVAALEGADRADALTAFRLVLAAITFVVVGLIAVLTWRAARDLGDRAAAVVRFVLTRRKLLLTTAVLVVLASAFQVATAVSPWQIWPLTIVLGALFAALALVMSVVRYLLRAALVQVSA